MIISAVTFVNRPCVKDFFNKKELTVAYMPNWIQLKLKHCSNMDSYLLKLEYNFETSTYTMRTPNGNAPVGMSIDSLRNDTWGNYFIYDTPEEAAEVVTNSFKNEISAAQKKIETYSEMLKAWNDSDI